MRWDIIGFIVVPLVFAAVDYMEGRRSAVGRSAERMEAEARYWREVVEWQREHLSIEIQGAQMLPAEDNE